MIMVFIRFRVKEVESLSSRPSCPYKMAGVLERSIFANSVFKSFPRSDSRVDPRASTAARPLGHALTTQMEALEERKPARRIARALRPLAPRAQEIPRQL